MTFNIALERTYLGYLRTSFALAFLSVFIAQLFRLQHTARPDPVFGFYRLGVPLSCICTGAAIIVSLLGTYRFWRQQNAMLRGKILCGGWEMLAVYGVFFIVCDLTDQLPASVLTLALDYPCNLGPRIGLGYQERLARLTSPVPKDQHVGGNRLIFRDGLLKRALALRLILS